MPKVKENASDFNRRMTIKYPRVFRAYNTVLFCLKCDKEIKASQLFQVKQHLETAKHLTSVERKRGASNSQSLLTTIHETVDRSRNVSDFTVDLAKCFLKANIPLYYIQISWGF